MREEHGAMLRMSDPDDDSVFYRQLKVPLTARFVDMAQASMFRLFCREFPPDASTRILDIGVSGLVGPHTNFLQRNYPYPNMITCVGLSEGHAIRKAFSATTYVQVEKGGSLPFSDGQFDVVFSNAVLEHVGGAEDRRRILNEVSRVGRNAFIAVPNRWFPIEHHTVLPLVTSGSSKTVCLGE